jgi:16S rRNA (adenine1518-N6/adenine1519-N6)-dimethyltransferase
LKIIFDDILKIDLRTLIAQEFTELEKISVCANLPYYITTPVILKLIKCGVKFDGITVMIQKEAADKLCSKAGEENYNATAAIISSYGKAKKMFNVPKSNFYPPPKVLSSVVKITPCDTPAVNPKNKELMFKVIDAAFEQRRKTLVNALISGLNLNSKTDKFKIIEIAEKITGNKNIRGEELDIKMFADISDLIFDTIK